jgi:hypothetical protein
MARMVQISLLVLLSFLLHSTHLLRG